MRFTLVMIFLINFSTVNAQEVNVRIASNKIEVIRNVIDLYQTQMYTRYGAGIKLNYDRSSDMIQANAGEDKNGNPIITIHEGLLVHFEVDEIAFVICHEIGHFLGHIYRKDKDPKKFEVTLEGESDYFAGACSAEYFNDPYKAIDVSRTAFSKIAKKRIEVGERYPQEVFKGIYTDYPSFECRQQSVINGALGHRRPTCWYNPKS